MLVPSPFPPFVAPPCSCHINVGVPRSTTSRCRSRYCNLLEISPACLHLHQSAQLPGFPSHACSPQWDVVDESEALAYTATFLKQLPLNSQLDERASNIFSPWVPTLGTGSTKCTKAYLNFPTPVSPVSERPWTRTVIQQQHPAFNNKSRNPREGRVWLY